ncbi:glycerate kinase [Heliomicrobium modesticaldum Ice1]|uniref:Glycerate kinase n=1 Tax=Heliobacterium modesticaldum (strain ATCC 51547 / Ice1) TaxID=498761 RepID=B0TDU9_HELMI|nr:glycerate kinase [Heliomicrobium modesticaldum]ABZ82812.1 glycerate kinase [Heliomicrobium modesticaldum Ice1]
MRIVVAPDSYKESLSALEVAEIIDRAARAVWPSAVVDLVPLADGGEGFVEAMVKGAGGRIVEREVTGPLGEPVSAHYGILKDGKSAVIEMAAASGLHLVPRDKRDPRNTTTFGTGELIAAAIDAGCHTVYIGIGGSATNDGGAGMAEALGVRLLDAEGKGIPRGGAGLARLQRIDMTGLHPAIASGEVTVVAACDVTNPLCGPTGASAVFGPQKGATPEMVELLDANLRLLATVVERDLGRQTAEKPGAGAAGGLGAGLMAFLDARLERGFSLVSEITGLEAKVAAADLVVTGEGKTDRQTAYGKVPYGVAKIAEEHGKPVIVISGGIDDHGELESAFSVLVSCTRLPVDVTTAMARAESFLSAAAKAAFRLVALGAGLNKTC